MGSVIGNLLALLDQTLGLIFHLGAGFGLPQNTGAIDQLVIKSLSRFRVGLMV